MNKQFTRIAGWSAYALLTGLLAFAAAGCGSSGGSSASKGASTEVKGLGSTLSEIKSKARAEGEVDLVIWAGYADKSWADQFTKETGCKVVTKDGATSDDMIDLISTGQYDGVSASGNATVRLMKRGDVAPVDTKLIPNYADVASGLKNQDYNSLDGQPYGVPHGRGPNLLMWRTDVVNPAPDSWSVIWNASTARPRHRQPVPAERQAVHGRRQPAQEPQAERGRVVGRLREAGPVVRQQGRCDRHDLALHGEHPQG